MALAPSTRPKSPRPPLPQVWDEPFDLAPYLVGVRPAEQAAQAATTADGPPADARLGPEGGLFAALALFAAFGLGQAVRIANGCAHPLAWAWLGFSLLPALALLVRRPRPSSASFSRTVLPLLAGGAFVLECAQLMGDESPAGPSGPRANSAFFVAFAVALALGGVGILGALRPGRVGKAFARLWFPALLAVYAAAGIAVIRATPATHIDVQAVQRAGLDAVIAGRDPFAVSFPDLHHNPGLYAPGVARDGIVHLGFCYPPLTLLLDLPGHALLGDYRYSNLAAMCLAALLMGCCRPGALPKLIAALFLFTPRGLMVLECGWTEPQVALCLSACVFCACRRPKALPWVMGLLLVSKQYMALAVLPALLALPRPWRGRGVLKAGAVVLASGLAVSLPVVLWDPAGFWASNFASVARTPLRMDALSYLPLHALVFGTLPPPWVGFAAAAAVTAAALARLPRSAAGFAAAVAAAGLAFFAFGKLAFCNYYYFLIAAFCCVAAATRAEAEAEGAGQATCASASA